MTILETRRFVLRAPALDRDDDRDLYCSLYTDEDVMGKIAAPLPRDVAERGFERACVHVETQEPGHRYWLIFEKESGAGIGFAGLTRSGSDAEIGVVLLRPWWKSGVSSETFIEIIAHAFGPMALKRITAERPDDDHALVIDRLLERFGFVRTPERATAPTQARWELHRTEWQARTA